MDRFAILTVVIFWNFVEALRNDAVPLGVQARLYRVSPNSRPLAVSTGLRAWSPPEAMAAISTRQTGATS